MKFKKYPGTLPFDQRLAPSYEALDLPYGAALDEVNRRYESYLEKCRPDLHADNPERLADAFKLTGILTFAHGEILEAWIRHGQVSDRLPFDKEIARCYQALDLPYGAPLDQVARRWKEYLKKCHPDRWSAQPAMIADATRLTQELTRAYEKIKDAWLRHLNRG